MRYRLVLIGLVLFFAGCAPLDHMLQFLAHDPVIPQTKQTEGLEQRKLMNYYTADARIYRDGAIMCRIVTMGLARPVLVQAQLMDHDAHRLELKILRTESVGLELHGTNLVVGAVVWDAPEKWQMCL